MYTADELAAEWARLATLPTEQMRAEFAPEDLWTAF